MFKLGRGGGGRSGGKRALPLPPPSRPATAPGAARLSFGGGGRGRPGSAPGGGGAPPGREESFSLSSSADLDFGAIIRLTPDLIEEIKRVDSQGGSARIKFSPNFTIPQGNVIDVGGKEFGFTWSRDELCDIYEESQSGEGGDGLLVECGSAWRKLNVLRTLDESTKKHVKKRSEEAERLHKSRKAKFLDPSNPSMKNQVKKMAEAGVEGNMRRMGWKQKKEPLFKKQKVEPNEVSGVCPPKSVFKSGTSSNKNSKVVPSVSPIPSPSEQPEPGAAVSPFATAFLSRDYANLEEITPPLVINKEHIDIGNFEKETPSRSAHGPKQKLGRHKGCVGDQPVDLQNSEVRRASENSNGTSLKALEKAAGETTNPVKKNASKIKNIEAPGMYIKSGVEVESSKQRESESGSSPVSAHDIALATESIFGEKFTDENLEQRAQPSSKIEEDLFENIDIMQDNPDPFSNSDKKINNDNEGKTSSSDSDSDSESDSSDSDSDSGSQSRSRSKSRSPAGSASASSSDSETGDSSSSKEGSDVDVDIMGEDEKGEAEPKAEAADLKLCSSPRIRASDGEQEQIDIIGDQEEQVASLPIDLNYFGRDDEMTSRGDGTNDFPNNNSVKISENPEIKLGPNMGSNSYRANSRFPEVPFSPDQYKHSDDPQLQVSKSTINTNDRAIKKTVGEKQSLLNDCSAHQQIETTKKTKTKREKPDSAKKSKGARAAEVIPYRKVIPYGKSKDAVLSANYRYISPEKARQDQYKSNNIEWGGMKDIDPQEYSVADQSRSVAVGNTRKIQQSPELWSSSSVEAEQPGPRTGDASARRKSIDRFSINIEKIPIHPDSMPKDKMYIDTQEERNVGEKFSSLSEYNRKSGDHGAHLKDNALSSQIRKSDGNKSPDISGKGSVLRRELSELELGELREPRPDGETGGFKRQPEGKDSFKPLENKAASTDSSNVDVSKGSSSHPLPVSMKHSPHNMRGEVHRKLPPDDPVDTARILQRTIPSLGQQPSRVDHADSEVKSHLDKPTELTRRCEMGTNQGTGLENHAGFLKKNPTSLLPQHEIKHGGQKGYKNAKESKQQKPNTLGDSTDRSNVSMETEINGRKRRESSTEDDNSFYSKYDKEIPEFRDSIKNFSQYNDYVQEYREKYDCYISLNKKLENIRNDFLKIGEELELAKGRGSAEYSKVVDVLREMYRQRGERNKQMKRIFIVLHEELKTLKQRIQDFVEMHTRN